MDVKSIFKWALFAIVAFIAFRWLSSLLNTSLPDIQGGTIYGGAPYAAPLTYSYPIRAWAPPNQGRWGRRHG